MRRRLARRQHILLCATALACVVSLLAGCGGLDGSFGASGELVVDPAGYQQRLVTQPDGRIVMGEDGPDGLVLRRFTSAGNADPSFGDNGQIALPELQRSKLSGHANFGLAAGSDGELVAAAQYPADEKTVQFVVTKLHADGRRDDSFGSGGTVIDPVGVPLRSDYQMDIALGADGRVIAAVDAEKGYELRAYGPTGARQPSFGDGGSVVTTDLRRAEDLAIDSAGRVVVAVTQGEQRIVIERYSPTGGREAPAFSAPVGGRVFALAVLLDDSVVVQLLQEYPQAFLVKFHSDGTLDRSYAFGGVSSVDGGGLVADADGSVFLLDPVVEHILPNGTKDDLFLGRFSAETGVLQSPGTLVTAVDDNGRIAIRRYKVRP